MMRKRRSLPKEMVMSSLVRLIASRVQRTIWSFSDDSSTHFLDFIYLLGSEIRFAYEEGTSILPTPSLCVAVFRADIAVIHSDVLLKLRKYKGVFV
jgi:hypothetical protein